MLKAVGTALMVAFTLPLIVAGNVALVLMAVACFPGLPVLLALALAGNVPWSWVLYDLMAIGSSLVVYGLVTATSRRP